MRIKIQNLFRVILTLILLAVSGWTINASFRPHANKEYNAQAGATYYVANAPLGNDANPGTTPGQPWARCPGMPGWTGSAVLQPGDTVYFNNSGTWETSTGDAVLQVVGGVTYDGKTWGSGSRATLRAMADLHRSVINLMEDDPNIPTVIRGFEADANGQETSGIAVNWPQTEGNMTGAIKRIEDCVVHDTFSESAAGSYEYGIVVSSGYGGNRHVSNVEILDCETYNISRGGVNIYVANDDPASSISNVLVRGCNIYATGLDSNYAGSALVAKNHAINVVFEYNTVHDPARGIGIGVSTHDAGGFNGPENLVIRHNIIANSRHAGMYIQGSNNISMDIYGNLIVNSRYDGLEIIRGDEGTFSARVYNNTFYHNYADDWGNTVGFYANPASVSRLEFKNNIVYAPGEATKARCLMDEAGILTQHTNNIYYHPGGGTLALVNGVYYEAGDIATWEPTALTVDPLLENPSNLPSGFTGVFGVDKKPDTDGLSIKINSPAKDFGVALDTAYNRSINSAARPQGAGWDIGAYEFVPSLDLRGAAANRTIHLNWTVNVTLPVTTTWHIDYYTQTNNIYTVTNLTKTIQSTALTENVVNYQWYTVSLYAMPDKWLSDTVRVMPTDRFVYLPLVLR